MGIRGLTSFLSQYSNTKYEKNVYLRDCTVIIDGLNAAFFLYQNEREPNANKVGGDYVGYAKRIRQFFLHLKNANIFPIVVLDGAHNRGKFETVNERYIQAVKDTLQSSSGYVPIGLKIAFVEILKEQNISHIQTFHDADNCIAFLSEQLNAPVISSDSDFQVYSGVEIAIPLQSIKFKSVAKGKEKIFVLYAKVLSLKIICKEAYKFEDHHMLHLPLMSICFGNDFCAQASSRKFAADGSVQKFGCFLDWVKTRKGYQEKKAAYDLVEDLTQVVPNDDEECKTACPNKSTPPSQYLGYVWACYRGMFTEWPVLNLIKARHQDLKKQKIVYDQHKITVEILNESAYANLKSDNNSNSSTEKDAVVDELSYLKDKIMKCPQQNYPQFNLSDIPDWFIKLLRSCELPAEVLDIFANHKAYLWPQAEVKGKIWTQEIAIPLLQIISRLVGCSYQITFIKGIEIGPEKTKLEEVRLVPPLELPKFGKIPHFCEPGFFSKGRALFLAIMECTDFENFIDEWPATCQFSIATILYFLKRRPYCIAIGIGVILSILHASFMSNNDQPSTAADEKISSILKTQRMNKNLKSLYKLLVRTEKLGSYDRGRVHSFCEFKAVFAHAKSLNMLLGNPFRVPKITNLNSYIVYHVQEMVSTKFLGSCEMLVKDFLGHEPIGKVLTRLIKFTEDPNADAGRGSGDGKQGKNKKKKEKTTQTC